MGEACSTHGQMRNAYSTLVGKPGGASQEGLCSMELVSQSVSQSVAVYSGSNRTAGSYLEWWAR